MSEILTNTAARRFLDLDVEEVSLVDTPANEQPFLTAKRKGTEDEMSVANTETQGEASGATVVPVEVTKAESDVVAAAMAQVTALVDGIAKAAGISEPSAEVVEKSKGQGDVRSVFEQQLKNAGLASEAITKAMSEFDKACGNMESTTKNKDAAADQTATAEQPSTHTVDDSVLATLDTIQKAKAFTPARLAKLAEALETLQKLMMDVIPVGASPKTSTPGVSQHSNPNTTRAALVGTQKSVDGEGDSELHNTLKAILAKLDGDKAPVTKSTDASPDLAETLKSIQSRIEKIEQARPASKAEGDDDKTASTQKSNGSFWKNIL